MAQEVLNLEDWVRTQSAIGYLGWDGLKTECSSGWLSQELVTIMEKTYKLYEPQKNKLIKFIQTSLTKKNNLKFKDISVTNQNEKFLINFGKNKLEIYIDFEKIINDVKQWPNLNLYCLDFLRSEAISTLFELQDKKAEKLEEELQHLKKFKQGITKHPRMMIEAETMAIDIRDQNLPLFQYLQIQGEIEDTKDALVNRTLAHLNNHSGFIFDAIMSYIKDYRHNKNKESVDMIQKSKNGKQIEELLEIKDTWHNFCFRAGAFTNSRKKELFKELDSKGEFHSIGIKEDRETKEKVYTLSKNFISIDWDFIPSKKTKNLINNTKELELKNIIIEVKKNHISSILKKNPQGDNTRGFLFFPELLQAQLMDVFDNPSLNEKLKNYCKENKFKIKGERWSNGIRKMFINLTMDVYYKQESTATVNIKGYECHPIELDHKTKLKEYAKTIYPRSICPKTGKFAKKRALEYFKMALKAIQLANEEGLEYLKIIDFVDGKPSLNIYVQKLSKQILGQKEAIRNFS